jgi:hypothetical protein
MFVTADLIMFHIYCVSMFKHVYDLVSVKFHMCSSNDSLVIAIRMKAKKKKHDGHALISHSTKKNTLGNVAYFHT